MSEAAVDWIIIGILYGIPLCMAGVAGLVYWRRSRRVR